MFKRILQSALDGGSRDSLAPEEINYLRRMTARDKTITWKTLRVSTFVPLDIVNDRIALVIRNLLFINIPASKTEAALVSIYA